MMNFRALARALVAACAVSAVVGVSAASAAQFKAEKYPALVKGVNAEKVTITTRVGTATCSAGIDEMYSTSLMTGPVEKMTTYPKFGAGCSVPIQPENCVFTYTVGKALGENVWASQFAIEYPGLPSCNQSESKSHYMVIKFSGCTATFKAQIWPSALELQNYGTGSKRYVLGRINTNLAYELNGTGLLCKPGTYTDGILTGSQTFEAFTPEGTPMGLFIE